ncbi:hypothetical protein AGABI1DRAFT_111709 [Agaricus bisporus var. burnettii JB137-S8]|uniref:Uncharacterized protein n=1 Tax=Agaricus bisporus var. burnettii (strain JB137-S8 / ATCC MYA-4627 / FGSC 10392) TaxID=597362 RepID=K5Y5A3_AGABU|nr:uncharacterized protein AGABI1DRAFT_111709 [Agaricus bisporus var. burnettii JB137-S8]EKM83275.1 hypothetical protein AGABI1DRAFT_111709 [Agaricus bisporus var. burnettii JB137-S8]
MASMISIIHLRRSRSPRLLTPTLDQDQMKRMETRLLKTLLFLKTCVSLGTSSILVSRLLRNPAWSLPRTLSGVSSHQIGRMRSCPQHRSCKLKLIVKWMSLTNSWKLIWVMIPLPHACSAVAAALLDYSLVVTTIYARIHLVCHQLCSAIRG